MFVPATALAKEKMEEGITWEDPDFLPWKAVVSISPWTPTSPAAWVISSSAGGCATHETTLTTPT